MSDLISRRLRYAREKSGLTQAQLSEKLGFKDRQTLAAIEAGQRKLSAEELLLAVDTLGVDLDFFTDSLRLVGEGTFSWRADRKISAGILDKFEQSAGCWIATCRQLGEDQGIRTTLLQKTLPLTARASFEEAMAAGDALAAEWQLGNRPARELESAIREKLGALILHVDAPKGISGAACRLPGLNTILINRNEPEGRRNYDLAHECFHLLSWDQMPPEHTEQAEADHRGKGKQKRIEQLADNFAAALLMPSPVLGPIWAARGDKEIHLWLNQTASDFLVTAKALRWRLANLGWLARADQLDIQEARLTANGRPDAEQRRPRLFDEDFVKRLHTAIETGGLSVRRCASILECTIEDLADLFRDYGFPVPFDL
ncbi:MAG: helix-turn-helix domain-containing protein [Rhodocyclales bacterium]|nr:helix-turn-helix domain-containing protein [Rhodocyclales bacterium]